jgi:RimJ/RimL family protein N-acetyltransferase
MAEVSTLLTSRLRLRARALADLDANLEMDLHPEVHPHVFSKAPDRERHKKELVSHIASGWPPTGGLWVIEWIETPGFLGWCAIWPSRTLGCMELGYRLARRVWQLGIATEAATAVVDEAFEVLECSKLGAVCARQNHASRRVLERLGFAPSGSVLYGEVMLPAYHLTDANHRQHRLARA